MLKKIRYVSVFLLMFVCFSAFSEEGNQTFQQIEQAAEQGDALAQAKLGSIYFLGEGFELEPRARFMTKENFKKIAYLLPGVPKNDQVAASWLTKAADQGFVDAEVFIAALYDRGIGVKQSEDKATEYYKKAESQGNDMAKAVLGPYARSRLIASNSVPVAYSIKILNTK